MGSSTTNFFKNSLKEINKNLEFSDFKPKMIEKLDSINFCLLDVSDFERIQRLKKRHTYGADQNMLNWSAWLRMHTRDPQWTQHVIKDDAWDGLDFSSWDQSLT